MVFAGLGWLTFLSAPLATFLYPYNFAPGMIGEGALIVWLLGFGVQPALIKRVATLVRQIR